MKYATSLPGFEPAYLLAGARGSELLFLPSYSPNFLPIEEAFSKLEARLRREMARTKEALVEAIGRGLDAVSERDAQGFFHRSGYPLRDKLPSEPL